MSRAADWPERDAPTVDATWVPVGAMGVAITTTDDEGGDEAPAVLFRLVAIRHDGTGAESDRTYLLDETAMAEVVAGLIRTAHDAFGRERFQAAMFAHLFHREAN